MSRTIAAIVNPVSGRRDMTPQIRAIEHAVRMGGGEFSVHLTERSGHATEIAANLAEYGLLSLFAPVCRVAGYDAIMPLARLEKSYIPSVEKIIKAVKKTIAFA